MSKTVQKEKKTKKHGWNLRKKLVTTILIMSIVPMLVLGMILYFTNVKKGLKEFQNHIKSEIGKVDDGISSYFNAISDQVAILAETDQLKQVDERISEYVTREPDLADGTISMTPEKNDPFERALYHTFKRMKDNRPQFLSISLGVEKNGGFLMYPEKPRKKGYDARERSWYQIAKLSKEDRAASDFYVSSDGSASVELMNKIYDADKNFIGVLNFSLGIKEFQAKIADVKIGKTGFLMVLDKAGNIVSHQRSEFIGKKIEDLGIAQYRSVETLEKGEVRHTDQTDRKTYIMWSFPSKDQFLGWTYVLIMDKKEMDAIKGQHELFQSLAIIMIGVLVIAILFSLFLSNQMTKPIRRLSENAEKIANFDLRTKMDEKFLKQSDEIGILANSMEIMAKNLRKMVSGILNHSHQTAGTAQTLTSTAQRTAEMAGEVSGAVGNIAQGAVSQAEDVKVLGENLDHAGRLLTEMETVLAELSKAVENIRGRKDEGNKILDELKYVNDKSREEAVHVNEIIVETNASADKIANASSMIQALASQTNLLALNASIEAARAGEHGKGFAVVAEEIRKLAEESDRFTEEIRKVIAELQKKTGDAVNTMEEVGEVIKQQNQKMHETHQKFDEIELAVERGSEIANQVTVSAAAIRKSNSQMVEAMQNLSAIAEKNATTSHEATTAVDMQVAAISEITQSCESLGTIATELEAEVSIFTLE